MVTFYSPGRDLWSEPVYLFYILANWNLCPWTNAANMECKDVKKEEIRVNKIDTILGQQSWLLPAIWWEIPLASILCNAAPSQKIRWCWFFHMRMQPPGPHGVPCVNKSFEADTGKTWWKIEVTKWKAKWLFGMNGPNVNGRAMFRHVGRCQYAYFKSIPYHVWIGVGVQ